MSGKICLKIDNFEERKNKNEIVESEYFYDKYEPYKLSLRIETNPRFDGDYLHIYLLVWHDDRNEGLTWPFKRNVDINLINQDKSIPRAQKTSMEKPANNSCRYSDAFSFHYSELNDQQLLTNDCITVRCYLRTYI